MSTKKLEETNIPELVSREMAANNYSLGATHVGKILKTVMTGASKLLGDLKDIETPKAIAFRRPDGTFVAGAKVEYHKNPDDPDNMSAGNWSYIWTFYEKDLDGASIVDFSSNNQVLSYIITAALKLFNMKFNDNGSCISSIMILLENISHWLEDNAKEGERQTIEYPGAMVASCEIKDGVVVKSIVPDGELKVMIKGDDMYQDDVA